MSQVSSAAEGEWHLVCALDALEPERGVTALIHGQGIAIFRMPDDQVYALGNHDPYARASAIARGIVGFREDVPFVASPSHRHPFDLRTGRCLDDPSVRVPAYETKVVDGQVYVGARKVRASAAS